MMFDKPSPVIQMASSVWLGVRSRLSLRVLFPLTFLCLVTTIIYICAIYEPIPTSPDLCKIWRDESPQQNASMWWQWACLIERDMDSKQGYECRHLQYMGNWPVCWDEQIQPREPCLVYSFGIDGDFSFDDAMAERGCTVYSFDPRTNRIQVSEVGFLMCTGQNNMGRDAVTTGLFHHRNKAWVSVTGMPTGNVSIMGQLDHKHAERVFFKNMGLGAVDSDTFHPKFDIYVRHTANWKMRTLKSIMKILGHEKRHIDVLKIDIEVYEWAVVANILKDNLFPRVRQFLVEWHIFPNEPSREKFQDIYEAYMGLRKQGLEFYYKNSGSRYHHYNYFNSQADMCYVNTKFQETS